MKMDTSAAFKVDKGDTSQVNHVKATGENPPAYKTLSMTNLQASTIDMVPVPPAPPPVPPGSVQIKIKSTVSMNGMSATTFSQPAVQMTFKTTIAIGTGQTDVTADDVTILSYARRGVSVQFEACACLSTISSFSSADSLFECGR